MKVSLAQLDLKVGDLEGNSKKILKALVQEREEKTDLTVFTELTLTGYPPKDLLLHKEFVLESKNILEKKILPETKEQACLIGLPWLEGSRLYNALACINNSRIEKVIFKKCLPNYEVFNEARYFRAGRLNQLADFSWKFKDKNLFIFVCEDFLGLENNFSFYEFDPIALLKQKLGIFTSAEKENSLIICTTASPYRIDQAQVRIDLAKKISQETKLPVCLTNQVGASDDLIFDGNSFVLKENSFIEKADSFQEEIFTFNFEDLNKSSSPSKSKNQSEEIKQALITGIKAYFQKNNFESALIGLSGGIDSALVAYLAVEALGAENLRVILMPSEYSAKESFQDAKALIDNLKIKNSETIEIDQIKELFLEKTNTKKLTLVEENLQARIRGNLLMTLSGKYNSLLLSTGNKSELAIGYTTLYGDLCGALSPIADLWKSEVFELAKSISQIPSNIINKKPSAELRPNQTDQDSLPAYQDLDPILKDLVEDKLTSQEIKTKYPNQAPEELSKIIKLVKNSEYKRAQAPIILKLKKNSFSKNNWFYQVSSVNL